MKISLERVLDILPEGKVRGVKSSECVERKDWFRMKDRNERDVSECHTHAKESRQMQGKQHNINFFCLITSDDAQKFHRCRDPGNSTIHWNSSTQRDLPIHHNGNLGQSQRWQMKTTLTHLKGLVQISDLIVLTWSIHLHFLWHKLQNASDLRFPWRIQAVLVVEHPRTCFHASQKIKCAIFANHRSAWF